MKETRYHALLLFMSSLFASATTLAHQDHCIYFGKGLPWPVIVSLGGGVAISSDVGKSKTFSIINPVTDEFFIYHANQATQTAGLLDLFIGVEWPVHTRLVLQVGLGYDQAWNFLAKGLLLQGADVPSADLYAWRYNILTRQLMAEGKLLYHCGKGYYPYVLLGLGAAFNRASDYGTTVPPFLTFTRQYHSHTQSSFTYALGIGMDMDVVKHFRIGAGYRFADSGKVHLGDAKIDTNKVGGTLSQNHLYANEIILQITYVI